MSRAQKLVNRTMEIVLRRQQNHLNDQKALAEIRSLVDRTEDRGTGRASEQVKLIKKAMLEHEQNALSNQQAMSEISHILALVSA
jgi:hypothetical protein